MVVKIGSSTVVGADGKVNRAFIGGLADQAAALRKLGWRLVVVSSGRYRLWLSRVGLRPQAGR